MRRVPLLVAALLLLSLTVIAAGTSTTWPSPPPVPHIGRQDAAAIPRHTESFLDSHVLVNLVRQSLVRADGNPRPPGRQGAGGRFEEAGERVRGRHTQAGHSSRTSWSPSSGSRSLDLTAVIVAVKATPSSIDAAGGEGGRLQIDPRRADRSFDGARRVVRISSRYLQEPDVYLALDPEFSMGDGGVPGQRIGRCTPRRSTTRSSVLEYVQTRYSLPRKVLMVHQFTMAMLPDKEKIWTIRPSIRTGCRGFGLRH